MSQVQLISHRGNLYGEGGSSWENHPEYIQDSLDKGFDCEIDLWVYNDVFYLGHDEPTHKIEPQWIVDRHHELWIHCKNPEAFSNLRKQIFSFYNFFWHETDQYTLTSLGFIWAYPSSHILPQAIIAVPEMSYSKDEVFAILEKNACHGICSDYVAEYRDKLSSK